MAILKKLDKSSKLLILISLTGILISLVGFYQHNRRSAEVVSGSESIGSISNFQNDVRVRRAGDINWYQVKQSSLAYANDLLFTGENSSAVIELSAGNKIILHANSLVSLSKNKIALESGTIDIDLTTEDGLELDSFGETFELKDKMNLRVTQTEEQQNIVALNDSAKNLSGKEEIKKFFNDSGITILAPGPEKIFPQIDEFEVSLRWKGELTDSDYEIEFWTPKSQTPFLKMKSSVLTERIPLKRFPDGLIFWKVSGLDGKVSDRSSFYISRDIYIRNYSPINNQSFPFTNDKESTIQFEWMASLDFPQKIQVARDEKFQMIVFEGNVSTNQKSLSFKKEGNYFWRVGYLYGQNIERWSSPSKFQLKSEVVYSPISIKASSEFLDFSLNPIYEAIVNDPNPCEEYDYKLTRGELIVHEVTSKSKRYQISKMPDGIYSLRVACRIGDIIRADAITSFVIKTSPPLQSPKILKKKKPLFVQIINRLIDQFIPGAKAAADEPGSESAVAHLQWEGSVGVNYEIEIIDSMTKKIVIKEYITTPYFYFRIPRPGKYLWRIRFKDKDRWSPYSDYDQLDAIDKIRLIKNSLMLAPENNHKVEVPYEALNSRINFFWNAPYTDFKYYLEIYTRPDKDPTKTFQLSGNKKTITIKNEDATIWWRVYAVSPFGNKTVSTEKFRLQIVKQPKREKLVVYVGKEDKPINTEFRSTLNTGYTSSTFDLNFENSELVEYNGSTKLAGLFVHANSQYWPKYWKDKYGLNLGYNFYSLGTNKYSNTRSEIISELGYAINSNHILYPGVSYNVIKTKLGETGVSEGTILSMTHTELAASFRYLYRYEYSPLISLETNVQFLARPDSPDVLSFRLRPVINYKISQSWRFNILAFYERNASRPTYTSNGASGKVDIVNTNMSLGLGFSINH